jgi:hypothetical protein
MKNAAPFILLVAFAAAQSPSGRVVPNDPYFKCQVSFLNPGGKITIERTSIKPSPVTLDAAEGIDANLTRAWTVTTGSRKTVVAVLTRVLQPQTSPATLG